MRSIARLLLGPDGDELLDLLGPEGAERRMTARVEEAGDWCQSTPSADSAPWAGRPPRARHWSADPRRRRV